MAFFLLLPFYWSTGLQGDHKRVMAAIERGLHSLHEKARSGDVTDVSMDTAESDDVSKKHVDATQAFLKVDTVEADSPASEAVRDLFSVLYECEIITFFKCICCTLKLNGACHNKEWMFP